MSTRAKVFAVCTVLLLAYCGVVYWMVESRYKGIFYTPAAVLLICLMFFDDFIDYRFIEKIVTKIKNKGK